MFLSILTLLVILCVPFAGVLYFSWPILVRWWTNPFAIPAMREPARCGVDLPRCGAGLRCMNGYCVSDHLPGL